MYFWHAYIDYLLSVIRYLVKNITGGANVDGDGVRGQLNVVHVDSLRDAKGEQVGDQGVRLVVSSGGVDPS